jgi:hypothetical protein
MKIDLFPKRKRFLSAPLDEVALHVHAKKEMCRNITKKQLREMDPDLATAILYHQLLDSKKAELFKHINAVHHANSDKTNKSIKILIVPSLFYREYPEVGGDGLLAQSIFKNKGFQAEIIPINSRGSVTENKEIIRRAILQESHPNIWLLSISKGTADLRACLQEFNEDEFPVNIKSWINFSGIFCGSILADHRLKSRLNRYFLRIICIFARVNFQFINELSTQNSYWKQPLSFLKNIEMIHVIGFPLSSHIQPLLSHRFEELSKQGPTDGMIDLIETLNYPGHIFPIWGCDHFARDQSISKLLYQLCQHISNST